jgi:hypothetical protein
MVAALERISNKKDFFQKEYGEKKFRKISEVIKTSNKIQSKIINQSVALRTAPGKNDFLYCLNEIPYFIFCKADTLEIGALLALELWHETVNSSYSYLNDFELNYIIDGIISDCNKRRL